MAIYYIADNVAATATGTPNDPDDPYGVNQLAAMSIGDEARLMDRGGTEFDSTSTSWAARTNADKSLSVTAETAVYGYDYNGGSPIRAQVSLDFSTGTGAGFDTSLVRYFDLTVKNTSANSWAASANAPNVWHGCKAESCGATFRIHGGTASSCESLSCTTEGFNITTTTGVCHNTYVESAGTDGYAGGGYFIRAVSHGASQSGWDVVQDFVNMIHCVADGSSSHGFEDQNYREKHQFIGCVISNNGGYGLNLTATGHTSMGCSKDCIFYNNTSGNYNLAYAADIVVDEINADPQYQALASDDFLVTRPGSDLTWSPSYATYTSTLRIGAVQPSGGAGSILGAANFGGGF